MRYTDKETLFVVVNFAGEKCRVAVNLTEQLFEAMGCRAFGKVIATDLMTDRKSELDFMADKPVEVELGAYQVKTYLIHNL